jgi:hypothetical protein
MRNKQAILILLLNVPPLLGLIIWPFAAMMSPMIFDAPGSENNPLAWVSYYTVLAYPFLTITGAILSYFNCKGDFGRRCLASTLLTYSGVLAILLVSAVIAIFGGDSSSGM